MFIRFERPEYIYLLFLIPIFIFFHFFSMRSRKRFALQFANFDAIAHIKGIDIYSKNLSYLFLAILITAFISLSLAGTIFNKEAVVSDYSFVIAVDNSESMAADDLSPTRLDAAKYAAIQFIDGSPIGTKIGIISFSGNSRIEYEVTADKAMSKAAIRQIQLSDVSGTDIQEAVMTSNNLLTGEPHKAVVMLSDGQINVGDIEKTLDYAQKYDLVAHTVAMGTPEGGAVKFGISNVDYQSLQVLSYGTKGISANASTTEALGNFFSQVLNLKKGVIPIPLSTYLLVAALVLFIYFFIKSNTHIRALP